MLPVIALVGRPNVGKSTLFNQLTRSTDALVVDLPGTTRDRRYGEGRVGEWPFIVIDTGGIGEESTELDELMSLQTTKAIDEADLLMLVVDAQSGLMPADALLAKQLRKYAKKVIVVVNKTDGLQAEVATADFSGLGFQETFAVAAKIGRGINKLISGALSDRPAIEISEESKKLGIKVAVIGQPNVGKSTLVNRMLKEDRLVTADEAGTTRDSILVSIEHRNQKYTLIDTAGIRRKKNVKEAVEKFSIVNALQSIEMSNVVLVVIDAKRGVVDQDLHLIRFVTDAGKGLVIVVNKWDGLSGDEKKEIKEHLKRRLDFVRFAYQKTISALHGTGVGDLWGVILKTYQAANQEIPTSKLTDTLKSIVTAHPPPMVRGRRIKLRYAHMGGLNPPTIVIHGNQTEEVPVSYQRYLVNAFRKAFKLDGTPILLQFKTGDNPYKDKRNKLTPRQERKRKRLKDFIKKR